MRQQEVEARTYRLDSILEPGDITLTCGSCGYEWIADAEEVTRKVGCLEAMCPACETVNRKPLSCGLCAVPVDGRCGADLTVTSHRLVMVAIPL